MEMCITAPTKTIPKYFSLIWYHLLILEPDFCFPWRLEKLGFYCSDNIIWTLTKIFCRTSLVKIMIMEWISLSYKINSLNMAIKIIFTNLSKHIQNWIAPDVSVNECSIPYSFVTVKIQPIISAGWSTTKSENFKKMQSYVDELTFQWQHKLNNM